MSWAGFKKNVNRATTQVRLCKFQSVQTCRLLVEGYDENVCEPPRPKPGTCQTNRTSGHVERTNDRDYEVEERRYRTMESAANRLQKEAKGYLDSLRGMDVEGAGKHCYESAD